MEVKHCTCTNFKCALHPTKHDNGCSPCIEKNLRLKEVPTCFFNLIDPEHKRLDDSFQDFADCVMKKS